MDTAQPRTSTPELAPSTAEPCCGGRVASATLDAEHTAVLADRLKALADPTRLRMLDLLVHQEHPLCVCDITSQFPQNQPTISHHLRLLREAGLAACDKRGVWAYYWATEAGRKSVSLVKALL